MFLQVNHLEMASLAIVTTGKSSGNGFFAILIYRKKLDGKGQLYSYVNPGCEL